MAIELIEKRNSRSSAINPKSATLRYTLKGTTSETMARSYAIAATPWLYGTLYRQDVRIEPVGLGIWDVEVPFGPYSGKAPETGDFKWSFDTTGGTMHITNAIAHIADYAPAGETAPNHEGAIGVNSEGDIEGCDIGTSSRKWTETWQLSADLIPFNYGDILEELTYTTNNATFRGKPAGHVLFLGATADGSSKAPSIVEGAFHFATGKAMTSVTVSGITITKLPWEWLWYEHAKSIDATAKRKIKKIIAAHREQVFYPGDFSLLGIGIGTTPGT